MPDGSTGDVTQTLAAITYLLTALGLSSTAGLRAYLPLLAVGLAYDVPTLTGQPTIPLQGDFQALGNPIVLIILGALMLVEFLADKVPVVDHISDAIHTVIRPLAGAAIMAGTSNPISTHSGVLAAALGGALALGVHAAKAGVRPAVTATTAGVANPLVSLIEDVLVIVTVVLLVLAPVIGFILLVLLILLFWRIIRGVARGLMRIVRGAPAPVAATSSPHAGVGVGGRRRRGRRTIAAVIPSTPSVPVVPLAPLALPMPAPGYPAAPAMSAGQPGTMGTPMPTVPATPTGPTYYDPNIAAPPASPQTQQAVPVPGAYPPGPPAPTQPMPGAAYPGDAPTLPGIYPPNRPTTP